MVAAVLVIVATVGVLFLADLYYRLITRWCPPDPRPRRAPRQYTEPQKLARLHRRVMERYFGRHPFDQELR